MYWPTTVVICDRLGFIFSIVLIIGVFSIDYTKMRNGDWVKILRKLERPWLFDRNALLVLSIVGGMVLFLLAKIFDEPGIFSGFGALITVCGLFLNIKHTMAFHLNLPLRNKYYLKLHGGGGGFRQNFGKREKEETIQFLSDEIYGVGFMIFGALISAYGNYLI